MKEQKSREYANWLHKNLEEQLGHKCAPHDMYYRRGDIQQAFEVGWDEALKWISTKERMPEPNVDVIFLTDIGMVMSGHYDDNVWLQMDGVWGSAYCSIDKCWEVIAWMPIPTFDKILEDNEDVLKRLKDAE